MCVLHVQDLTLNNIKHEKAEEWRTISNAIRRLSHSPCLCILFDSHLTPILKKKKRGFRPIFPHCLSEDSKFIAFTFSEINPHKYVQC